MDPMNQSAQISSSQGLADGQIAAPKESKMSAVPQSSLANTCPRATESPRFTVTAVSSCSASLAPLGALVGAGLWNGERVCVYDAWHSSCETALK
ncbi:unnamed protein product [Arctogadus glacialis]